MNHFFLEHDTTPLLSISNSSGEQLRLGTTPVADPPKTGRTLASSALEADVFYLVKKKQFCDKTL